MGKSEIPEEFQERFGRSVMTLGIRDVLATVGCLHMQARGNDVAALHADLVLSYLVEALVEHRPDVIARVDELRAKLNAQVLLVREAAIAAGRDS